MPGDLVFRVREGSPLWYARRWDPGTRRLMRRSTGCTQRRLAEEVAMGWRREHEAILAGRAPSAADRPLAEHIEEFVTHLRRSPRQPTPRHVETTRSKLTSVAKAAGWTRLGQVSAQGFLEALETIQEGQGAGRVRGDGRGRRGRSAAPASNATKNRYRAAWVSFCRWLVKQRRLPESPMAEVDAWRVKGFEVRRRAALRLEDARRLLRATREGPERHGLSGEDRAMLYRCALATGFRREELASLRPADFRLAARTPHVVLRARAAKNRKPVEQPIERAHAAAIAAWLAGRPADRPVWGALTRGTAAMVRADLEAAGLSPLDGEGRILDFHSLRHTYVTWLAQNGVTPQVAQKLARHSSVQLTMEFYTHLSNADLADQLEGKSQWGRCALVARRVHTGDDPGGPVMTDEDLGLGAAPEAETLADAGLEDAGRRLMTARGERPERDSNPRTTDLQSSPPSPGSDSESESGSEVARVLAEAAGASAAPRLRASARARAERGELPSLARAIERIRELAALADESGGGL